VTTSLRCGDNFIGCRSRDEWSSRLRVLYTNRWLQRRRRTCLQTFILPPSIVAISRSSSYRSLAVPRTRTTFGDRSFTVARPRLWNSLPATLRQITSYTQFRRHLKHIYLVHKKPRRIVTFIFHALYKYTYLLTYLLRKIIRTFS